LTLIPSITASAKGSFSFITIARTSPIEIVRTTDPALTDSFFAFADFSRDEVEAPANPGVGYEVTRYFVDRGREIAFDHLHYYPRTGFVYYDGIVNGWSDYDRKWYTATPEVREAFEKVLPKQTRSRRIDCLSSIHYID
jgi:hypothetical protein